MRLTAVGAVIALVVAGAIFALAHAVGGASAAPLTGCELTSNPPLNDHAFNEAAHDGLTAASTRWGIGVKDKVTTRPGDWRRYMRDLVGQRCGLIVTIGSDVGQPTAAWAKANPSVDFAATDDDTIRGTSNLLSIVFRSEQASFLAGYLAAGMSKTHKVGTFGGIPIPSVTPFMNGFAAGVQHYNVEHGTHVRLLGWNPKTQTGTFVNSDPTQFGVFGDKSAATELTADLVRAGADVVFPVDGPTGEAGACGVAQKSHNVLLIGVDTDQHYATPNCVAQWLTSVLKIYRTMVYTAMGEIVHHRFHGGRLVGTLKNGGVGLARFYGLGSRVPEPLKRELDGVEKEIVKGSITFDSRGYVTG